MAKFSINLQRLSIDSENPAQAGDAFIAKTREEETERLGAIFGLVELFSLPDDFADNFFEIINDLKTEYYLPPVEVDSDRDVEKRFEDCLQRANRRINKLIKESIDRIELKNINTLIGLQVKNQLHLSRIGSVNAFLFHQKKRHDCLIVDIFNQTDDRKQKIDPEKMFSNIVSGVISNKDSLIFCNDSVLEYLSQNELMKIISENSSLSSAQILTKKLEAQKVVDSFYAVVAETQTEMEEETADQAAAKLDGGRIVILKKEADSVPSQKSINKLLSTQTDTERYLTPSLMPNWKKILILSGNGARVAINYLYRYLKIGGQKVWAGAKKTIRWSKNKIKKASHRKNRRAHLETLDGQLAAEKAGTEPWPEEIKTPIETEKQTEKKPSLGNIAGLPTLAPSQSGSNPLKKIWPASKKITSQILALLKKTDKDWNRHRAASRPARNLNDWLNNRLAGFFALSLPKRSLIIVGLILVFAFSQSIVWQGQASSLNQSGNLQEIKDEIEGYLNSAEAQNIFNDEAAAKDSLKKAQELLNQLSDKKSYSEIRQTLQDRINAINFSLQKMTYLDNPRVIADLTKQNGQVQSQGLSGLGDILLTFDNQNRKFYKIDTAKQQTLTADAPSNLEQVKKIQALDGQTAIILDENNRFYQFKNDNDSLQADLTANTEIKDFGVYGGKIYTLQPAKNQIFKHLTSGGKFNSGSAWLKQAVDLRNASALALDGGIFVIRDDGSINYYNAGKAEDKSFTALDPAIASPRQIFTQAESNYLYILDQNNRRIVVYDKSGNLKNQYSAKEFSELKAIYVQEKQKKIYVLAGNKIYLIEINF